MLDAIPADPAPQRIPAGMLTASDASADIRAADDHHVTSFIPKPIALEQFFAIVQGLTSYWLSTVEISPD